MDNETTELSERLASAQFDLFGFITILMHGDEAVSDVLQQTNLAILKAAERYDPSRPFMPWVRGVARKCVLKYYGKRYRDKRIVFSTEMIEIMAEEVPSVSDCSPREDFLRLRQCMRRLVPKQRGLMMARYLKGLAVRDIAACEKCSEGAISVMLHRIRQVLADCINQKREQMG